jgi:hypothetical protein
MKISTKPTNLMLVGFLFICILVNPALAEQQLNSLGQLNKLKEHHHSDLGMLKVGADIIYFAWWGRETLNVRPDLTGSISTSPKNVRDLLAINSLKQRDLLYKDSQDGDPSYLGEVNSQNIGVSGKGKDNSVGKVAQMEWQEDGISGRELENSDTHHAGNYLSIDVHDISVSAINTMQGGNAVATSNIIIEPVQIIVCPSEVDAKLK